MFIAMVACERVDLDFIETTPYRFRDSVELADTNLRAYTDRRFATARR